jgi:hypothetical protein
LTIAAKTSIIKYNSRVMEPNNTHHSQLISQHKCKLGEKPQCSRGRRTWPAQALDEHGQCKLQVSLASASSRWAWPAQSKLQESMEQAPGGEQTLGDYREVQRGRGGGEALIRRPGDTTVAWRGSARAATTASSQGKSPMTRRRINQLTEHRSRQGQGLAARDQARGRHGQGPKLQR